MKAFYFQKYAEGAHAHQTQLSDCIYIPDKDVVLLYIENGTFGGAEYSISNTRETLREARAISRGKQPKKRGVQYGNIMLFEYDRAKIQELISNARLKSELEKKVESGFSRVLQSLPTAKDQFPPRSIEPLSLPDFGPRK